MRTPAAFTPLEAVAGFAIGGPAATPRPSRTSDSPLAALAEATADALHRPPCVVSFSGGRDSSLLLAVAASLAKSRGLAPPLPVTLRYPSCPDAQEARWQERVIAHLGLRDWVRVELPDGLDCVGPVAQEQILRERAPLFPANAHSVVPAADNASGGTVLMGIGGDELLSPQRWRPLHDLFDRRRSPQLRDLRRLAGAGLPPGLRGRITARRAALPGELHWLRLRTRQRLSAALAAVPDDPVRFDRAVIQMAQARYLELGIATIRRIARSRGAELAVPLLDPRFVNAWAFAGGRAGWPDRTSAMRALGSDLLPDDVLVRSDKAGFSGVFFTAETRAFAERWSGRGLDEQLVQPEALRAMWLEPEPDFRSAVLLQSAWLHDKLDQHARVPALQGVA